MLWVWLTGAQLRQVALLECENIWWVTRWPNATRGGQVRAARQRDGQARGRRPLVELKLGTLTLAVGGGPNNSYHYMGLVVLDGWLDG